MKVAIMGAGLSGLSCALMLERAGVEPHIFEKRGRVNDRFINAEAMFSILNKPINDSYRYFAEEFQLYLRPSSSINQLEILFESEKAVIHEHVGFVNIRGRHHQSLDQQLFEQIKSDIHFHSTYSYEELLAEYTHVIMATGDVSDVLKLKNFREDVSVSMKGATVEGQFNRNTVPVWLDNHLAPKGYAYLLPYSAKEAIIVIAYPDLEPDQQVDANVLWERFFERASCDLDQTLKVTDRFQITNFKMGMCKSPRIGNTFFTGNCFGAMMPFLGYGQFESILTGVYAAYDICGIGNYDELTKPMKKKLSSFAGPQKSDGVDVKSDL